MADCPFCARIDAGEYIDRSPDVVWFEPLNPVTPGHLLFVPVWHATSAADRSMGAIGAAAAMEEAADYVAREQIQANIITSIGPLATQSVLHTHVHVVPRRKGDGLHLPWTGQVKK